MIGEEGRDSVHVEGWVTSDNVVHRELSAVLLATPKTAIKKY